MVNNLLWSHHKCSWLAITWTKVAMADGHILTSFWRKMDTWLAKNALHIRVKLRVINAKITKNVNQLPRFRNHTSLVEVGVQPPKKKWWKKFCVTVLSTVISKLQACSASTKKAFSEKKAWFICINLHKTGCWRWLDWLKPAQKRLRMNLNLNKVQHNNKN